MAQFPTPVQPAQQVRVMPVEPPPVVTGKPPVVVARPRSVVREQLPKPVTVEPVAYLQLAELQLPMQVVVVLDTIKRPVMVLVEPAAVVLEPTFLQPMQVLTPVVVEEVQVVTGPVTLMVETVDPALSFCLMVPRLRLPSHRWVLAQVKHLPIQ
jgi:hypothetical protein